MSEYRRHPDEPGLTRRQLLGGLGGLTVGYLGWKYVNGFSDQGNDNHGIKPEKDPDQEIFDNKIANEVAAGLLIDRGSYWQTESQTMDAIRENSEWDKEDSLLPIFPAAIMDYEDVMKRVSDELDVPINVVGIVASVESAGKSDADSGLASGLFQVAPQYHRDLIDRVAQENGKPKPKDDNDRREVLGEPYIGCLVGMEVLLDYHKKAIAQNSGLDPDSPVIWARALASYNGGPDNAGKKYEDMPLESQLYAVHAIRYIQDAAIASGLRKKGMSDQEIHEAMLSKTIDEDTYSYSKAVDASGGLDSIKDYELIWSTIAGTNKDKKLGPVIAKARVDFRKGLSGYKLPLTPALRIWTAHGGLNLLDDTPKNVEPEAYSY